jgi:hypothetical protein
LLSTRTQDSCGPSGCLIDPLTSDRVAIDDDPVALYELSLTGGWGDGLPLLPPTEVRVRGVLASTPFHTDDVIGILPPMHRPASVELAAVNAAMAGCESWGLPYVIAALEAMCEPDFNLEGITTTTSSAFPFVIVNGPSRERVGIDFGPGCMGGAAGRGSMTIGRAVSLCLRNIGGQRVGATSKSVFGQPGRLGVCFGEWEEQSPWPSLAEQWGYPSDADVVTVHAAKGTHAVADVNNDDPRDLLALIAKSAAFPLSNKFLTPTAGNGQTVIAVNPEWAARFGRVFPDVDDAKAFLWEHAWLPVETWPAANRAVLDAKGRVDAQGRVWLSERPDQFALVVCGGLASLHAVVLPSWGESELQHHAVAWADDFLGEGLD